MNLIEIYITDKQWNKAKVVEKEVAEEVRRLKFAQDDEDVFFEKIGDAVSIDFGFGKIQVCKENFDKILNKFLTEFD